MDGIRGAHPVQSPIPELVALRRERDPELRGEAMLAFAANATSHGRMDLAAELYNELLESLQFPASIRTRAQSRLAALSGGGEFAGRAEVLATRFIQEATDPVSLLAMTVAGATFRAARFLTLARLSAGTPGLAVGHRFGIRALAGLAGFGAEATVFPLAHRLGNEVWGRETEWSAPALGREWASSFLLLGALRAGGLGAGALAPSSGPLGVLLRQVGLLGGIALGHELEARAGLRERLEGTDRWIDSLTTLLHFHVAGRLSRDLLGESGRRWERGVEIQSAVLERASFEPPSFEPLPTTAGWQLAGVGAGFPAEIFPDRVFMSSDGGEGEPPGGRRGNVISIEEFRRRRQAGRPPEPPSDQESETVRERRTSDLAPRSDIPRPMPQELWRSELGEAILHWVAQDLVQCARERDTIETRLAAHPPAFRDMMAYLASHHPLAAQLLMLRFDLLAENSVLRDNPMLRGSQWLTDFYSHEALSDIYERLWLRYVHRLRFDEAHFSLYDVPMSSPEFFENLRRTHPALVAALIHPDLPSEVFMPLIQSLEIFPAPRSSP